MIFIGNTYRQESRTPNAQKRFRLLWKLVRCDGFWGLP